MIATPGCGCMTGVIRPSAPAARAAGCGVAAFNIITLEHAETITAAVPHLLQAVSHAPSPA